MFFIKKDSPQIKENRNAAMYLSNEGKYNNVHIS